MNNYIFRIVGNENVTFLDLFLKMEIKNKQENFLKLQIFHVITLNLIK